MPKKQVKLSLRISDYGKDSGRRGLAWRKRVYDEVIEAASKAFPKWQQDASEPLLADAQLEVDLRLFLTDQRLKAQDVDNLVKHVLDALQGLLAGEGKKVRHTRPRIIDSDTAVRRLTVEKLERTRSGKPWSRLVLTDYVKARRHRSRLRG